MLRASSVFLNGAQALRVLCHRNPRRFPKLPVSDRRHLSIRAPARFPIVFSRMEETSISSKAVISSSAGRRERLGEVDCFELSSSSVLKLQKGDITTWFVDGRTDAIVWFLEHTNIHAPTYSDRRPRFLRWSDDIVYTTETVTNLFLKLRNSQVNAANEKMLGGGGVDGAIHRAAGPELKTACYEVPEVQPGVRCPTGEARITPAFKLPASRVIHTVGPIYGAVDKPDILLRNAYINSLKLAKENNIHYIAFPAISCGVYRYPFDEASKIAISAIKEFPSDFKEVHFVLFSDETYRAWLETALEFM